MKAVALIAVVAGCLASSLLPVGAIIISGEVARLEAKHAEK